MGEALAVAATFLFASSHITVKRYLGSTSISAAVLISLVGAWIAIGLAVLVQPPATGGMTIAGIILFLLAGLAAPGAARWAAMSGVTYLGPSTAVPITQSIRPLLVVAGAVALLGEVPSLVTILGVLAIVGGAWLLSMSIAPTSPMKITRSRRWYLAFPIVAGISYAVADLVAKEAVSNLSEPVFGAFLSTTAALTIWLLVAFGNRAIRRTLVVGRQPGWMLLSGALAGMALVTLFMAFEHAPVSIVTPIASGQPLVIFALSWLFLRDVETVTRRTVLAGVCVVAGTAAVAL